MILTTIFGLSAACSGPPQRARPTVRPTLEAKPAPEAPSNTRAWKPGASPCLGFKPDGSAAFVLLSTATGDNLSINGSHQVMRLDFATGKSKIALLVADESDCNLEAERCEEYGIESTGGEDDEGDARERADAKLRAAAGTITALMLREELVACVKARRDEESPDFKRWLLGKGATAAALQVVPTGKPDEDANEPARRVEVVSGKKISKAFDLPDDEHADQHTINGVYYLPGKSRVVVMVKYESGGETLEAHAVRY